MSLTVPGGDEEHLDVALCQLWSLSVSPEEFFEQGDLGRACILQALIHQSRWEDQVTLRAGPCLEGSLT